MDPNSVRAMWAQSVSLTVENFTEDDVRLLTEAGYTPIVKMQNMRGTAHTCSPGEALANIRAMARPREDKIRGRILAPADAARIRCDHANHASGLRCGANADACEYGEHSPSFMYFCAAHWVTPGPHGSSPATRTGIILPPTE